MQTNSVTTYSLSMAIAVLSKKNKYIFQDFEAVDFWRYYGISDLKTEIISTV